MTMTSAAVKDLDETLARRTYRTGQAYDLVLFDRLPAEEQAMLADLQHSSDFYGVLRPRNGSGRTVRAVGRDTALLWLTLRDPGRLPFFVWSGDLAAAARGITELVLDGVLEIEDGGTFVSGPAATRLVRPTSAAGACGYLAGLTEDALRYGASLALDDPEMLAMHLYTFGRMPTTPAWTRRVCEDDRLLDFLGASAASALGRRLEHRWSRAASRPEMAGWLAWAGKNARAGRADRPTYKLYVSPVPSQLPRAFAALVDVLEGRPDSRFKVGRQPEGVLRPDKLVAYFPDVDSLHDAAAALGPAVRDLRAHGVPFTSPISPDGLLSWGMDPPSTAPAVGWHGAESWRLWVARRLASAMVAAQSSADVSLPAWQFALERLAHDGVDVERWTPSATLFFAQHTR